MNTELKPVTISGYASALVVQQNLQSLGMVTKRPGGRWVSRPPWQAHIGIGDESRLIGSFYPDEGGLNAAVQAVCRNAIPPASEKRADVEEKRADGNVKAD